MPTWFNYLKDVLEWLTSIATFFGLITIALSVKQFSKNAQRERKQDEQLLIQNSINVLRKFADTIIPEIESSHVKLDKEIEKQKTATLKQINKELPTGQKINSLPDNNELNIMIINRAKSLYEYGLIFNQLEQVSVYMNYHMVKDELVYVPLHKVFLRFVNENEEYLNFLRSSDAPYANTQTLYDSWNARDKHVKDK